MKKAKGEIPTQTVLASIILQVMTIMHIKFLNTSMPLQNVSNIVQDGLRKKGKRTQRQENSLNNVSRQAEPRAYLIAFFAAL